MKKSIYLVFSIFIFLIISCASNPKINQNDITSENIEKNPVVLNDSSDEESDSEINKENNTSVENPQNEKPELEEVIEDVLPDLPVLENSDSLDVDKTLVDNEPEVKDEMISSDSDKDGLLESSNYENSEINNSSTVKSDLNIIDEAAEKDNSVDDAQSTKLGLSTDISSEDNESKDAKENDVVSDIESENYNSEKTEEKKVPVPSRSMTVKKNQLIDIIYPGKGWIYQENIDEQGNVDVRNKNFIFGGRKLGGENQAFTLRSRVPGKFLLHFYKNDVLTGNYIDDYLEVVVENYVYNGNEHLLAPNYAEIVPPKAVITAESIKEKALSKKENDLFSTREKQSETKASNKNVLDNNSSEKLLEKKEDSEIKTVIQTSDSAPDNKSPSIIDTEKKLNRDNNVSDSLNKIEENTNNESNLSNLDSDEILKKAKDLYSKKEYSQAFDVIQVFFDKAVNKIDEGLFLQAQILESKSSVQNIKGAVDSYDLVIKNYPTSKFWNEANKRSIYLKRFYINIR